MLLGGRVGGEALRLYMIYDAGNAIECQPDTPYLQIGEFKYGKPILDRSLDYGTPLNEAVKIGLLSFDSTMRSHLAVGLPKLGRAHVCTPVTTAHLVRRPLPAKH